MADAISDRTQTTSLDRRRHVEDEVQRQQQPDEADEAGRGNEHWKIALHDSQTPTRTAAKMIATPTSTMMQNSGSLTRRTAVRDWRR